LTEKQQVSKVTKFHTTEALLLERAQLHRLVDYFWKVLPNTRDAVYKEMATSLSVPEIHISDMDTEQIKVVAEGFQSKLDGFAPCAECRYGHLTSYGLWKCLHPKGEGAYWNRPDNAHRRCDYVQGDIPSKGSDKS
jgi:hypothetical protein